MEFKYVPSSPDGLNVGHSSSTGNVAPGFGILGLPITNS